MRYDCVAPTEAKVMYAHARYKSEMIGILADLMDGSKQDVCDLLGVPFYKGDRKRRVNPDRLQSMYESGVSIPDIAAEFGVVEDTVSYWINRLKLTRAA